ncbi:hypothetical protein B7495_10745 [Cryobacterium sp. LW097]|uniref:hypothetical protein n=1 Tax=unclassified Cryobacterium TaxID=2649013 RepID=UPI000B4C72E1|nr:MULTISPECIES: hypothetical protein [unclassified Cryobacterium]ASD22509.1 hypothetical protein B7495_10745 [Cryobacterium sp. LW097]TFC57483.1 hypothetical protein E3O60_15530 [Cryobacterium sp. TMB1-7]TFC90005.1 hypothetical protein E3T19_06885 [Cryobacterium sp. TMT4-31]
MSQRNTLVRSLHDVGLAAWFGGSLMGAVGLNSAAASVSNPRERLAVSSVGWKHWAPVQWAAMAAHGLGGVGLILGNTERLAAQKEGRVNTGVKLALTLVAIGTSVYSGVLGMKMGANAGEAVEGTTEPSEVTSDELASAQNQQRILQWVTPVVTLILIVLGAQQGEQQRPVPSAKASWFQRAIRR